MSEGNRKGEEQLTCWDDLPPGRASSGQRSGVEMRLLSVVSLEASSTRSIYSTCSCCKPEGPSRVPRIADTGMSSASLMRIILIAKWAQREGWLVRCETKIFGSREGGGATGQWCGLVGGWIPSSSCSGQFNDRGIRPQHPSSSPP